MAKRSVHLSEKTEALIGFLSDEKRTGGKNYSGSINAGLLMLEQLMLKSKPYFSEEEWVYLCSAYSARIIDLTMPVNIVRDIMDTLDCYDLSEIDDTGRLLIDKIRSMSQCQQTAILWEIKKRWQSV